MFRPLCAAIPAEIIGEMARSVKFSPRRKIFLKIFPSKKGKQPFSAYIYHRQKKVPCAEVRKEDAMAFDRQFLDELIARNDIVDVVSNYVSLQPRGGSLWGCCPFHSEKTPSFHVLPDKQLCYCFGCKKRRRRHQLHHGGGGNLSFPRCGALSRTAREHARAGRRAQRREPAAFAHPVAQPRRGALFTTISSTRPRVRRCSSI